MTPEWYILDSGSCRPAFNMALDEALLGAMPRLGNAVFRFYGWTEPAASFGYFQKYAEVEQWTPLRPLLRRPTAGGLVPHDADWTYSVAIPTVDPWYDLTAVASYRRIHEWLNAAFGLLGLVTEVAAEASKHGIGQCFVGHEQYDLLWRGRKIAGAAQRRTREGLLIQGSVQPPTAPFSRGEWQKAMQTMGSDLHGIDWRPATEAVRAIAGEADRLTLVKYSKSEFNRKR